jgi:23S rRNA pseudouridine1911/1915/1917 synthase
MTDSKTQLRIVVERSENGLRLDQFLAQTTSLSRRGARRLIDAGGVCRNTRPIRITSRSLESGDVIDICDTTITVNPDRLRDDSVPIVYEDRWLVIVNKPAGVLSQPSETSGSHDRAVDEKLMVMLASKRGRPPFLRLIHRLDRICSGVLLFAHHHDALPGLASAWKNRAVTRDYLAVVRGRPQPAEQLIDSPIARDTSHTWRFEVSSKGKPAQTRIRVLGEMSNDLFMLACRLDTGRTHQVRVHLQSLGHPLVADRLYGGDVVSSLERPFLHAYSLSLPHPVKKKRIEVVAPLPAERQTLLPTYLVERLASPLFDL